MKQILIDIVHPAHVHFFKEFIRIFRQRGGKVCITSRYKDIATTLLDNLGMEHTPISLAGKGNAGLFKEFFIRNFRLMRVAAKFKPDMFLGISGFSIAPVSKIFGKPALVFTDTEHATLSNGIAFPFAYRIITPQCYWNTLRSKKHIRYNGYHEIAYLHPNYFQPDASVLDLLGVNAGEKYVIIRFVGWWASHDVGHTGISLENKIKAVEAFSKYAKVFITSEKSLPNELEQYRIQIPLEKIHHALYYATLLYGESATMASESAVLGTPAIFLDDVGRGYTYEEERRYSSVFNFTESLQDQERSIEKGVEILNMENVKEIWKAKRQKLLDEKIDVTAWMVNFVENLLSSKNRGLKG